MIAYVILTISLMLVFIIIPKNKFNKYGIFLVFGILAIFYGTRNNITNDDQAYIWLYEYFSKTLEGLTSYFPKIEIGYKLICRIIGFFQFNYKAFFLFCAVISFIFVGKSIKKLKLSKLEIFIFILVYLGMMLTTYMTVMRQFLAISIGIYGLILCNEKKYKKGIFYIVIASTFHISAIIILLLMPLFNEKLKINSIAKISLPIIALILGNSGILNSVISILFSNSIYGSYIIEESNNFFGGTGIIHYSFLAIYVLQFLINEKKENNETSRLNNFLEKGEMIYLTLFFATINSGFALRTSYLFLIFLPMIAITFLRNVRYKKISYILLCCLFMIIAFKSMFIDTKETKLVMPNNFSIDFFNKNL